MKNIEFKRLIFFIFIIVLISCSPQSKESYLEEYKDFIFEISENSGNYLEKDWEKKNQKYEKFSGEWKEKFKDDFTWKDQITLTKYEFQYNLSKVKGNASSFFDTYLKEDYEKLKEQIKYYSENDMEEDLGYLIKQADEIGGEATKAIEEIITELGINVDELNRNE